MHPLLLRNDIFIIKEDLMGSSIPGRSFISLMVCAFYSFVYTYLEPEMSVLEVQLVFFRALGGSELVR